MTAKVRPVPSLPGKAKGSSANNYVSTCSVCHLGIFRHQPHVWGTGKHLGLIHTDCKETQ